LYEPDRGRDAGHDDRPDHRPNIPTSDSTETAQGRGADLVLRRAFAWPAAEPGRSDASGRTANVAASSARTGLWVPSPTQDREPREDLRFKRSRRFKRRRSAGAVSHDHSSQVSAVSVERPLASYEPISLGEASGFAARFAADYLSWDEEEPERRAAALSQYLADPHAAVLGWSGSGRQRADLVIPGRTVRYQGAVVVEITARVVLYQRTGADGENTWDQALGDDWPPMGESTPPLATTPSSAPAPTSSGWTPGAAWWVPLAPPVRRHHDGRLVIDLCLDLSGTS
jgi:hypothetical protein